MTPQPTATTPPPRRASPRRQRRNPDTEGGLELVLLPPAPAWWRRAACLGMGVDKWQVDPRSNRYAAHVRKLKAICAECPVRAECFDDALIEPYPIRLAGPMRAGITGRAWGRVYRSLGREDGWISGSSSPEQEPSHPAQAG